MIDQALLLYWFIRRPHFYKILKIFAKRKIDPSDLTLDNTKEQSIQRCVEISVDTDTALRKLTNMSEHASVRGIFPDVFDQAEAAAKECPVIMGGPGDLDLLYWCTEHLKAERVVETGVAYGWSSLAILLSLQNRADSKLFSTDLPYPDRNNASYVGCVVPVRLRPVWTLLRNADRQALPKALSILQSVDLCHYDSDKSYHGRMWGYPRLWDALRPGGLFLSDDIGDNIAFWDFAEIVGCDPTVVLCSGKYVGILRKPSRS